MKKRSLQNFLRNPIVFVFVTSHIFVLKIFKQCRFRKFTVPKSIFTVRTKLFYEKVNWSHVHMLSCVLRSLSIRCSLLQSTLPVYRFTNDTRRWTLSSYFIYWCDVSNSVSNTQRHRAGIVISITVVFLVSPMLESLPLQLNSTNYQRVILPLWLTDLNFGFLVKILFANNWMNWTKFELWLVNVEKFIFGKMIYLNNRNGSSRSLIQTFHFIPFFFSMVESMLYPSLVWNPM